MINSGTGYFICKFLAYQRKIKIKSFRDVSPVGKRAALKVDFLYNGIHSFYESLSR